MQRLWCAVVLTLVAATGSPLQSQTCAGDCDGDGQVTIAELIRGVRIALGQSPVGDCAAMDGDGDGSVSVSELVRAVRAALEECVADTPTPTSTALPTSTRTPPECGDGVAEFPEECDDGDSAGGDGCTADCQLEVGGNVCAGSESSPTEEFRAVLVASGLENPVHATAPPLDPHRLFIVEQPGRIRLVKTTASGRQMLTTPFLDIVDRVRTAARESERGLLSVAFHPDYEENGWFFVNYNCRDPLCPEDAPQGSTIVSRFEVTADPDRADRDSERVLLAIPQFAPNHNGGQLAFGPDGMLYIGMGDGGGSGDPLEASQRDDTVLGKMLRADVDVEEAPYWRVPADNPNPIEGELGLIWAKGLRNPWRFSFDRVTGDLYIGDVGQNAFEEIDVQPGTSSGGENYGWDIFEGRSCFEPEPPAESCPGIPNDFVFPVLEYGRSLGTSVTGGFVYRGCTLESLDGTYFYSDFLTPGIRSFFLLNGTATRLRELTDAIEVPEGRDIRLVSSYGEDARGELYLVDHGGEVFMLAPQI